MRRNVLAVNDSLSRELYTKVRVLCWVMTGPQYHWSKARHVKQTWGRRCNIIVFISSEEGEPKPKDTKSRKIHLSYN